MLKMIPLLALLLCYGSAYAEQADPSAPVETRLPVEQGSQADAIARLQRLLEQHPDQFQSWFLLGVTQAKQRRFHDAIDAFNKVITLQPQLAEPHNNLAVIYNELGDFRAAVKELEASLKLKPDYTTAQENIGDLYVKLAADAYRKALEHDGGSALRQRYEHLLHIRDIQHHEGKRQTPAIAVAPASPPVASNHPEPQKQPIVIEKPAVQKPAVQKPAVEKPAVKKTVVQKPVVKKVAAEKPTTANHVLTAPQQGDAVGSALAAVESWRLAWSKQDVAAYFAAYAAEFEYGTQFKSLMQWKHYKQWAITKKTFIRVTLENIEAKALPEGDVRLIFLQHFRSKSYNSDDIKQLLLRHSENGWKIIREISK